MLSAGTRIGPYNVRKWIREGFCGQSYSGEASSGEEKGQLKYLKLFHRELSEKEGFTDYFSQECRAIQQIEGRGVWPMLGSGPIQMLFGMPMKREGSGTSWIAGFMTMAPVQLIVKLKGNGAWRALPTLEDDLISYGSIPTNLFSSLQEAAPAACG